WRGRFRLRLRHRQEFSAACEARATCYTNVWVVSVRPQGQHYQMGNFYAIKNRLSQNVIDIQGASTKAGALLDAFPETPTPSDNQLWEFVSDPSGSGYFFIKSKLNGNVIDSQGRSEAAGAPLDSFPQSGTDNQLWQFFVDPVTNWYFIMSKLNGNVIDIQGRSAEPKALLNSSPPTFP